METIIPSIIRNASINKDQSKINSLGPYCYVLMRIVQSAEANRMEINHTQSKEHESGYANNVTLWRAALV